MKDKLKKRMKSILPKYVLPIYVHDPKQEDRNVICIGLQDVRTGEIFDAETFRSAGPLDHDRVRMFSSIYLTYLEECGVL